jgi:hypothetical protein
VSIPTTPDPNACARCGEVRDPAGLAPATAQGETGLICNDHPAAHFHAAKVLIGPLQVSIPEGQPTVRQGCHLVRVILVNGQIFAQWMLPFGLEDATVVANWDQTWKTDWRRVVA